MSGQAQNDIATASGRKDAVRKAFNQEYLATQQAMSQAAERARAQVLDQKQTIAGHAENVKAGTQAPQPPIGAPAAGQASAPPAPGPQQGAPHMASDPNPHDGQQVMFEIANEIRKIIAQEIDLRMQALSEKVETALAEAFPPRTADKDQPSESSTPDGPKSVPGKKG
ncbi:hypothetical protein [Thalassospira sp.]|uniref:hypothetical protein n=1 Tax=Thalassospira sp. TaxID=1912094 RepID=UPI000C5497FB|nr:hypothetical protein [Thalassospira sp.]MBC07256.1 hypothetical protein [Thalassospira sp.]|tara:strand:- start:12518 stop:13021 length:504 start_codon:yes stop_codon:yes gene_type:complete